MQSSHRQGKMPEALFPLGNNVKNPDRNLSGKSDLTKNSHFVIKNMK